MFAHFGLLLLELLRFGRLSSEEMRARVVVDGEERVLGPGGLCHVESTTPRRVSNVGDDDLVLLVIGGKGGYVERDGQLVDADDAARRADLGRDG